MNLAAKYEQLAVFMVNGHTRTLQMTGSLEFYEQKINWEMKLDG